MESDGGVFFSGVELRPSSTTYLKERSSESRRTKGVSMGPGATALTLIRLGCSSLATARVKCSTGALEPA